MTDLLHIDGSTGIGGGQILRTALSLSTTCKLPFHMESIRMDRDKPGLSAQHLAAVRGAAEICDAEVDGDSMRSTEITFVPGSEPSAGRYTLDVSEVLGSKSAGSVSLLCQTFLLPLVFADGTSHLTLRGGTHVAWSPPAEYLSDVYLPTLEPLGVEAEIDLKRWGFFPEGGGGLEAEIRGNDPGGTLEPMRCMERGDLYVVDAYSAVSNLPDHIRQRQAVEVQNRFDRAGLPVRLEERAPDSPGPGTAVYICARYEHASAAFVSYGRIGKPAEDVGAEAVRAFMEYHRTDEPVQPELADQLLVPLSLASGRSEFRTSEVTGHLRTNATVIESLLDASIHVRGDDGEPGVVSIEPGR